MRHVFHIFLLLSLLAGGCIGKNNDPNAKLELNVETVNFCYRSLGETVVWNDVQVRNLGKEDLTVSKMAVRGNASCAFEVFYPTTASNGETKISVVPAESDAGRFSKVIIPPSGAMLLSIAYTPSSEDGELDRADLLIKSDALNVEGQLVIPMCGAGALETPSADEADGGLPDASVSSDAGETYECEACGAPLKKGADACES